MLLLDAVFLVLNKCIVHVTDQTEEPGVKMFCVCLQVAQIVQGVPACSAVFLCSIFSVFHWHAVGAASSGVKGWGAVCAHLLVLDTSLQRFVWNSYSFLSFKKIYRPVIQMHHPNFNQVIKVQLSPQKFLKENVIDALEENHIYLAVLELTKRVFSPENNFAEVESQLASQQTHFSSVFSKCLLFPFFHANHLVVPGSAPVHNGESSCLLWLFF